MKKIKIKSKTKPINIIIIIIISILICSLSIINIVNKKITPSFFKYAEIETRKISNIIINDAISKAITEKATPDEIFKVVNNKNDEIKSIDFNTININKYLTKATKYIQEDLQNIEKGNINNIKNKLNPKEYNKEDLKKGIISYVNSGVIFNSPLLANLGPKIPIKLNLAGDIISYISAEVEDLGINNSLIKVFVNLKITETVILPFYDKNINMEAKVPIAIKLVTGKIPQYYAGSSKESKKIIIPN